MMKFMLVVVSFFLSEGIHVDNKDNALSATDAGLGNPEGPVKKAIVIREKSMQGDIQAQADAAGKLGKIGVFEVKSQQPIPYKWVGAKPTPKLTDWNGRLVIMSHGTSGSKFLFDMDQGTHNGYVSEGVFPKIVEEVIKELGLGQQLKWIDTASCHLGNSVASYVQNIEVKSTAGGETVTMRGYNAAMGLAFATAPLTIGGAANFKAAQTYTQFIETGILTKAKAPSGSSNVAGVTVTATLLKKTTAPVVNPVPPVNTAGTGCV